MKALAALAFVSAGGLAWWLTSPAPTRVGPSNALGLTPRMDSAPERVAELEPGSAPILPESSGVVESTPTGRVEGALDVSPLEADAPMATVVYGALLDEQGAPVEDAWTATIDAFGVRRNQRTRADGTFAFADLPPGKTRLQSWNLGWMDATAQFDLAEGEVRRHDLSLTRAPLVRVRCGDGNGRRVRDMLAEASFAVSPQLDFVATLTEPGAVLDPRHPGGNNTYDVGASWDNRQLKVPVDEHPEAAGLLVLRRAPPVWVSLAVNQQVVCKRRVESTAEPVHLTLTVNELRRLQAGLSLAAVDDETGDPLCAKVAIGFRQPTQVAADGTLALERLAAGPLELSVAADGYITARPPIALSPGVTLALGVVRLRRPARIAGRVVDINGAPLLVEVAVEPVDPSGGVRDRGLFQTGAGGGFDCAAFPPGRYTVRVRGDDEGRRVGAPDTIWTSSVVTVDTRLGPRDDVVVVAERPVPFRIEVSPTAAPLTLRVVDAEGFTLRSWAMVPEQFWSLEPRSLKLPQGRFELIAAREGALVGRWPLDVGAAPGALRVAVQ